MEASLSKHSAGMSNLASGTLTGDGTIANVACGFTPRHVKVVNETDVIVWERFDTMGATKSVKTVTAGTTTIDTTSAITFSADGFSLAAAVNASGKVLHWIAND